MATQKEIANKVGVSVATVSYVLTGRGSVGDEVKERVLQAAQELGYKPNRQAQAMRTGKSQCIGLVIPDLTNPFYPELAQKIESVARDADLSVIMVDCQNQIDNEAQGLTLLEQQGVDGVIWCPSDPGSLKRLAKLNCPTVLIDRAHPLFDGVHCDYKKGGQLLADYVIKLGHTEIGLLTGPMTSESAKQRRNAFVNAAGDKINLVWEHDGDFSSDLSEQAISALKKQRATMVVAANDLVAVGAINALQQAGIKVPEQVSVVGFDNIPWGALITPKLTTIDHSAAALATEAMAILVAKIAGTTALNKTSIIDVSLIERGSARAL